MNPITLATRHRAIFEHSADDMPAARLLALPAHPRQGEVSGGTFASDISLVNWPQIDYWLGPLIGVSDEEKAKHLEASYQLSLSFLYWMQTEAPTIDGGTGYPGLRLRSDVTGTTHGLAKAAYIREARRIRAEFTVSRSTSGSSSRRTARRSSTTASASARYRIDLHPSTVPRTYVDISSWPFQIPLGSLIPQRVENLLPANKNLGVTHITNGCYRLHPVEWNIGEAAGALAAWALETGESPRAIRNDAANLTGFQDTLVKSLGFELDWPSIRPR